MAPVEQLGYDSWWMVCAACCHVALIFVHYIYAFNDLYNLFLKMFFKNIFLNLV